MNRFYVLAALLLLLSPSLSAQQKRESVTTLSELRNLLEIDRLPEYRQGIVEQISSYDPTGGNEDGFAGKYSFLREEDGNLILADLEGPGVVNRIWTPTPTSDTLLFYFDGEKVPRLKICFADLFSGKVKPFVRPLCANEVGGYYCYFPFVYERSLKIAFTGKKIQFHQIQYRSLEGRKVETYVPENTPEIGSLVHRIVAKWSNLDPKASDYAEGNSRDCDVCEKTFTLAPGEEVCFFSTDRGGRIEGFEIEDAGALQGLYKDLVLKARWDDDDSYAINAPAADYFGYAFGTPAMRSMLIGSSLGRNYSYLPAPFDKKAEMTLKYEVREGSRQAPVQITTRVYHNQVKRLKGKEGRYYTCWRRDPDPAEGEHYKFLEYKGKGHYVGTVHLAQGKVPKMTEFFEGDDSTYVDGRMRMHGTGSEDYFNGGWYALLDRWDRGASMPLHGALDYSLQMSRTGGYRFYLNDKMSFEKEMYLGIEHGPVGNKYPVDYTSVAYFYAEEPSQEQMEPVEELREVYVPRVHPFFPQTMMITLGSHVKTQYISSGIRCWASGTGMVRVMLDGLPEGKYKIYLDYCANPEGADFSIWQRQKMIMDWKSSWAPERQWVDKMYCGEVDVTSQSNTLTFRFKGDKYTKELEFSIIYLELVED
jgi:hypothetical protein